VRGPVDPYGPSANGAPPRQPLPTEAAGELTRGNGGFRDPGSVAAPYADVRAYRTELGRDVPGPTGQRLGPAAQLYGPTTEAMRATALREGVNRQDFDNTMARTQAVETRGNLPGDPMGDYGNLLGLGEKKPLEAYSYLTDARQNAGDMGMIEATQHPSIGGIMGDQIKLIGKETINNPDQGAAGPRQLGAQLRDMHPESRSIMFGDQAPGMTDVMNTSQAFNYPTSQTGLHKAVGGSTDRNMLGVMLSNVLDNMGGTVGAALTMGAMPILTRLRALGLNSPHAINALGGGPAPPMNFSDLMAGLTAAETAAQERSIVRKPGR
jgi:hypothetical protein